MNTLNSAEGIFLYDPVWEEMKGNNFGLTAKKVKEEKNVNNTLEKFKKKITLNVFFLKFGH